MKKSVSLVLSSGGARGLAHIGVIEELQKHNFEIRSIAGSSMGSLVGGFYAAGKLDIYKQWICELDKMDVFKLIDFTFSPQGFIRGERVFKELENMIEDCNIEDLSLPFVAVATDLHEQKEVVFRNGSLFQAIRASCAIPTVLKPVIIDDKELVDGGVLNPLPIDLIQRQTEDILVVVNVNSPLPFEPLPLILENEIKKETAYRIKLENFKKKWISMLPKNKQPVIKKLGFFDLLVRSFDLMQDRLSSLIIQRHQPDLYIEVSRQACTTFEFYKACDMIELGRKAFQGAYQKYQDKMPII
ncbi:MAG: patatin-like phospholipase family protein [Candidatus Cyclobacteriaceae bacterium M3_2C_046]